jgi:gliding motility-associated-like protein
LDAGNSNVSYLWNDGSQLSQLSVQAPGVYSLTVSNACGMDADSVTIIDGGLAPLVSLGTDTAICPGSSITIIPTYANVDTWHWPDGSDTTFFNASAAGQVIVEVSNGCGTDIDSVLIELLTEVPSLDLGPDTTICPGETVTLSILIPAVTILWPDNSTGQEYSVSDSTTVIASISNSCGVSIDSLNVDLLPTIPVLNLGPDQTLCPGETLSISPGINNVQYLWQDGSTANVFQTTQPDTIVLMISNICGSAIDTMVITESTTGPQLDLGPDIQACEGTIIIIPAGILGVNYQWQDGSTNEVYTTSVSGIFHLTVDNLCGSDHDTIVVDLSGLPPSVSLGEDTILCVGSTLTLMSTADASTAIAWQNGSSDLTYDVVTSGIYHLTETNMCGTDSDTIDIQINGLAPNINLGPDTTLCQDETLVLTADADAFTSLLWQDGSTSSSFEVVSSGIYYLTHSNTCGSDLDSIVVLIEGLPPSPDLGPDTTLCEGVTFMLTSPYQPGVVTQWQDGSSGITFLVDAGGLYSLHQINHCGEGVDTIVVTYQYPPPSFDLGADTILCPGETLLLSAPFTTESLEWQDGSNASIYLAGQSGIYSLIIQNECGSSTDDIQISYDENFIQFAFEDEVSLCPGDIIILDATQSFAANYLWSTASSLPSISITTPGNYAVTVRTDCEIESHSIIVNQDEECDAEGGIYIPNVFSPNGDYINDEFTILHSQDIEITSISGTIYDRWGGLIYHAETNPFTWDGRVSGEDVLPGVYVYQVKIGYLNNGREFSELFAGDVTVLR